MSARRRTGSRARTGDRPDVEIPVPREVGPILLGNVSVSPHPSAGYESVVASPGEIPYFELRLRFGAGSGVAPAGSALPRMLEATFMGGTRRKTSEEISLSLRTMGAGISCRLQSDGALVSAGGLTENFERVLELLAEILFFGVYPDDEVGVSRSRVMQSLAVSRAQPSRIAGDVLRQAVYKSHPYGHPTPEPESAAACERSDLLGFHRKVFRAPGSRFVVVSDLSKRRIARALREYFDGASTGLRHWTRPGPGRLRNPKADYSPRTILVHRPGSVQTVIRVAMESPTRKDPRYHAFLLANTVFGGYFSSRLVENVREHKGYAYGISSSISHRRLASMATVSTDVATEVTAPALVEIYYELDRMRAAPPGDEELESARRYLIGATGISLDTYAGTAAALESLYSCGLDERFLLELRDRLYSVSAGDVYDAACDFLDRSRAVTVLVGDAAKIERPLRRICGASMEVVESPASA